MTSTPWGGIPDDSIYGDDSSVQPATPKEATGSPTIANTMLAAGWVRVEEQLPAVGKPVIVLTDYGKCDVCRLRVEDGGVIVWVNDMRPQHTNGSVIAWCSLPACG